MLQKWLNKRVFAWSLYDFADQAFSVLFITFFFPLLIKVHLGGNEFQLGLTMGLAALFAAFVVPVLGAFSDATGKRVPILVITAFLTAFLAVATSYMKLLPALVLAFFAYITHLISKDVYDAKMIDVAPKEKHGTLSGLGLTLGYVGTIASLGVAYLILSELGWEELLGIQAVFWQAGIWYILFSLPVFFMVPDIIKPEAISFKENLKKAWGIVLTTVKGLPKTQPLGRFLAASFFYNNAMNTVVVFLVLFGREAIGLGTKEFFPVFVLMALTAGAGAFGLGKLSDRFGPVFMIKLALLVWLAVVASLIFVSSYPTFLTAGAVGGVVFGGIWTLNRHMIARISPKEKIAELFGFEGLTEKFSGVLGPIVFGALVVLSGYTAALISTLIFFLLGLFLMRKISPV